MCTHKYAWLYLDIHVDVPADIKKRIEIIHPPFRLPDLALASHTLTQHLCFNLKVKSYVLEIKSLDKLCPQIRQLAECHLLGQFSLFRSLQIQF